ncbi:MAG: gamma carbonic anhydrase family protein [Deltaproteobacteria bacterium]|nr:gamma carbonic anhydrase family protein [Deltaproteobacteria bacterium]MCB9787000.1 gamma carbonic anhydrase family protein [Deltaproteobacteria bacterium]
MSIRTPGAGARLVTHHGVTPRVAEDVFVADTARVIGDVHIGPGSSVWYGSVIRGDVFHIRIGARVNIQDLSVVHVTTDRHATLIGDDVTVGHRAILHGCSVGSRCLIGMSAVVMDGAVIGDEVMIGAGALVTPGTIVPPRTLAIGSPARVRRDLTEDELRFLSQSAGHYQRIAASYLAEGPQATESTA